MKNSNDFLVMHISTLYNFLPSITEILIKRIRFTSVKYMPNNANLFTLHYFHSAVTIIFILLFTAESYISQWWGLG